MSTQENTVDPSTQYDRLLFEGSFSKLDVSDVPGRRIIAGYANVADVVDKQNEKVTIDALTRSWDKWKANPDYCMIMLMHTSTPVAKIMFEQVTDGAGNVHKSGVDDRGLYLVAEWRDDTVVANKAWKRVESGELRGFSIGGIRLSKRRECVGDRCFNVLEELEIYETSAVPKPANEWSVFGMLKGDLMELSKISNLFKECVIANDMVKISKTRSCDCGKYHIVLGDGLEGLKPVFETDHTRVIEKEVDGVEYVPMFNLALLRPYSIDEEAVTAESDSGGFESSPKGYEPKKEGEVLTKEVKKETKIGAIPIIEEPVTEVVPDPAIALVNALKAELDQLRLDMKSLMEAKAEPVVVEETPVPVMVIEPDPVVEEVPVPQEKGSVRSVPSVAPVPVEEPVVAPEPIETSQTEVRGKVPPPFVVNTGLNLSEIHSMSWSELNEKSPT